MALQDSDNFIVGRDEESYKITYQDLKDDLNYVPPPTGTIDTPQVLSPEDGAGSGDLNSLISDTITKVEGGGTEVYTTDTIASVDVKSISFTAAGSPTVGTLSDATDDDTSTYANFDLSSQLKITANISGVTKLGFITSTHNDNVRLYVDDSDNKGLNTNLIDLGGGLRIQEWVFPEQSLSSFTFSTTHLGGGSNYKVNNVLVNGLSLNNQGSTLTFPTSKDFDRFEVGEVVQDPDVSITAIDDSVPSITVDGGIWLGADGTGQPAVPGDTRYMPDELWALTTNGTSMDRPTYAFDGALSKTRTAWSQEGKYLEFVLPTVLDGDFTFHSKGQSEFGDTVDYWIYSETGAQIAYERRSGEFQLNVITPVTFTNITGAKRLRVQCMAGDNGRIAHIAGFSYNNSLFISSDVAGAPVLGGDTDITKSVAYSTKLTVASTKDLDDMSGAVFMTDGQTNPDGTYKPASYTLQTSEIASVGIADANWASKVVGTHDSSYGSPSTIFTNTWSATITHTNSCFPTRPGTLVFSPNKVATTLEFMSYRQVAANPPDDIIEINGVSYLTEAKSTGFNSTFTVDLGVPTLIETISWKDYDSQNYLSIGGIKFDGVQLTSTDQLDPVLTFNTPNPDLQYFQVGDVVQGEPATLDSNNKDSSVTLTNNNLSASASVNNKSVVSTADYNNSGKWYYEVEIGPDTPFNGPKIGLVNSSFNTATYVGGGNSYGIGGNVYYPASNSGTNTPLDAGDVIGIAFDADAGTIKFFINGTDLGIAYTGITEALSPAVTPSSLGSLNARFDPSDFTQDIPTEFLPWEGVTNVLITAIDTTANTMTVDGGEWKAIDATAPGVATFYKPDTSGDPNTTYSIDTFFPGYAFGNLNDLNDLTIANYNSLTVNPAGQGNAYMEVLTGGETFSTVGVALGNLPCYIYINDVQQGDSEFALNQTHTFTVNGVVNKIRVENAGKDNLAVNHFLRNGVLYQISTSLTESGETSVTGGPYTAEGTFLEADGTEVSLSASSGRWIADNKAGIPFSFVPATPIVGTADQVWGNLQIINDKAQVIGIQRDDPGFLNVTNKDYSVQFPSVFATGQEPDDDLPLGTAISVIVKAENSAGASVKESNTLLPQVPNPDGAAGPITDVEGGGTNVYTTDTIETVAVTKGEYVNSDSYVSDSSGAFPGETPTITKCFPTNMKLDSRDNSSPAVLFNGLEGSNLGESLYLVGTQGANATTSSQKFSVILASVGASPGDTWGVNALATTNTNYKAWDYIFKDVNNNPIGTATTIPRNANFAWTDVTIPENAVFVEYFRNDPNPGGGGAYNQCYIAGFRVNNVEIIQDNLKEGLTVLTFPTDNNFDKFEVGDVVQPGVSITAIDAAGPTITTDGGSWLGADNSGDPAGATDLTKTETYDSKLTVGQPANLDGFVDNDALVMVDSDGAIASYTPVTSTIASVGGLSTDTIYSGQGSVGDGAISAGREVQKNYLCVLGGAGYTSTSANTLSSTSYIKFDTPIVLNKPSTITIEANGDSGGWVTLNPAAYDNNAIPQTAGYTNFANMKGESWNTITFPEQVSVIEGFRWNGVNVGWANQISNMLVDGVPINVEATTLTFNTPNPDLKYFSPGDNVGTDSGFAAVTYTGNGGTQSIETGFSPDLVWLKTTGVSNSHQLFDSVRGPNQRLKSDDTSVSSNQADSVVSFDSSGFTLGSHTNNNQTDRDYVAWCWDAGDTTVTNNDGTIESQVRSNGNFSVVNYTGTSATGTLGLGLNSVPGMVIFKSIDQAADWLVYHSALDLSNNLFLNEAIAERADAYFTATPPTSEVISLTNNSYSNGSGSYVAYAWAETPGVSSFGSYAGNSSTTGPVIDCGFAPAFVMIKSTSAGDWYIMDSARGDSKILYPNLNIAEIDVPLLQFSDSGFQIVSDQSNVNSSSETYIYAAFAGGNPIEVVDVDVAANTMTVDGGSWLGSDGSGAADGDTEVTGPAKSGTGTFVSTNGIDTVNIENTNNEWISNDNRLSENFYIKKIFTALNANDPAHVALQQAVSAAFTAFPQKVNARRTSIASSLYRLMAGQTLSAEESAVLTATVRTAVNAVEPFALDGYYPLYYTADAANAASSVGDHHTHDMNGDTFYMPDGGTLYHGNYVAPEEEAVAETPAPTPTPTPTPDPTPDPGSGY